MEAPISFPAPAIPTDPPLARLLGLYPQRQKGLWMQRLRVPGGCLQSSQWRATAALVRDLTPQEPLHLTTRQTLEIHGLTEETVPKAQQRLAEAGLTGLGGCGDTIRNLTICPGSGIKVDCPDLLPLAQQLTEITQSEHEAFALPRKFKISLSACHEACALPWIHDIGFSAEAVAGSWLFRATIAGSLGSSPGLAIAWPERLTITEVPLFTVAALRLFAATGNRINRSQARLRHVREKLGDQEFLRLLDGYFTQAKAAPQIAPLALRGSQPGFANSRRLTVPGGNLSPQTADILADLNDWHDLQVKIGLHHELWLYAATSATLDRALQQLPVELRGNIRITACPGTLWCSRGRVNTQMLGEELRTALAKTNSDKIIAISGCPNGCAQSAVTDIGLIGGKLKEGEEQIEVYDILVDGDARQQPRLARAEHRKVGSAKTIALVSSLFKKTGGVA